MERDWERLGRAFADAREALGLTQVQVAERLHVSRTPIQAIERGSQGKGKAFTKVSNTMRSYARLLDWTDDSPDNVLAGGEPTRIPAAAAAPAPERPKSDLPPAVELELRSGQTLDSMVIPLGPADEDTRIVVILKGAQDMTEEELDRRWQQYRKARRHLQDVANESETTPDS
ncbi:helix-turn-helix domain-containing protein [Streptomyces sp. NPDC046821]|uniref:helix-turn-helix domain-containing protein n=1 Tax=Streptomyces sp. NPDC046821 TaxID=3154702 RepID=UPI0033C33FF5